MWPPLGIPVLDEIEKGVNSGAVQRETRNRNSHEDVFTYQELDEADAQRIRDLDTLAGNSCSSHN
jgi:hypothetical protein